MNKENFRITNERTSRFCVVNSPVIVYRVLHYQCRVRKYETDLLLACLLAYFVVDSAVPDIHDCLEV
jgi:hypothetical protein